MRTNLLNPGPLLYSLAANAALLIVVIVLGWNLAQSKPKCELKQERATNKANVVQRKQEAKRDVKLDKITTDTKAETRKGVVAAKDATHARDEQIQRAVVPAGSSSCGAPLGLPDLQPAVDAANTAFGD